MTNGGYVVAQLSGITPEGSVNFESVRFEVIQEIMKELKTAYLLKIHSDKTSLDDLASAADKEN